MVHRDRLIRRLEIESLFVFEKISVSVFCVDILKVEIFRGNF